ncbi:SGNH/GDSL hydrolase family protein [Umezawaea beigongshangensis]|uniref:SGNH/GDSL hydrolase family protein n=1 Tax=Umezawaea beigongshangensis TaxID=2780383 RepID=UPI0027DAD882|nr:SGNH/GDSL hydrolase family protein [Umezawaea beigongshangensis]
MIGVRVLRVAAMGVGALGGLSGATYKLLTDQSRRARLVIGVQEDPPPCADGFHRTDGVPDSPGEPLRFAVLGDSMAAGVGVDRADELPGVLLARGLAAEAERPVRLETHAVSGSTTRTLPRQVDRVLQDPPDVALVIVGANDVTSRMAAGVSAALLGVEVRRLRAAGIGVVVGTCPDLGAVRLLAQPLRSVARTWSLNLARAQRREVLRAGGVPVPLADLLAPEFLTRPTEMFSADGFHPSAAGYVRAAEVLLAPLCTVAGVWRGGPLPVLPRRSAAAEARRPTTRFVAWLNRSARHLPPAG